MRQHDARVSLADIAAAADHIQRFTDGRTLAQFGEDRLLSSAIERQLEIVGEALNRALRADPALAEVFPEATRIIGFRNILAHGYDRVSDVLVWSIATESLPPLVEKVLGVLQTG